MPALLAACLQGAPVGVDEEVFIDVEDTRLFAEIRGEDESAPVLLYLHGGPGSPLGVPVFRAYGGHLLEERFIVVYLHQRGIMKSPRVPDSGHSLGRYVDDVRRVVESLERRFPDREMFLLGHSWGGVLAYLHLASQPSAVSKLVAVSTPVDVESMTYGRVEMLLRWARETGNEEAARDLSPLEHKSVVEEPDAFEVLGRWSQRAYGGWARNLSRERVAAAVEYADSIRDWLPEQKRVERLLLPELIRLDLRDDLERIDVPLLCIAGREDVDVPWHLVREEMESYGGPVEFRVFESSHHMPFIDEEAAFVEEVVRFLDPSPSQNVAAARGG